MLASVGGAPPRVPHPGYPGPGAPELLRAAISGNVPNLVIMRMIKYLFKRVILMIITIIYDEIPTITKCVGGVGV